MTLFVSYVMKIMKSSMSYFCTRKSDLLSKGACLSRFFQLFDSVLQFLEEDNACLTENLRIRKADVAYLADLYFMFNEMNKQLLTEDLNLIKTKSVISAFIIEDEEISLQLELLDLQSNAELKPRLAEGYQRFWLQKQIPVLYPTVWAVVKRWLICLPSSSLVERAFSVVTDLITKKRNWVQLVKRGDLRLRVTSISPNID
ncbi:hypothetical protein M513_05623, partial [Trichuris suis]